MIKTVFLDRETLGHDIDLSSWNKSCELIVYDQTAPEQVIERSQDAEILILNKVKMSAELIDELPKLKHIFITATGQDNVDLEHCQKLKINVRNVAGYATGSVVSQTIAIAQAFTQRLKSYHELVLSGEWSRSGMFTSHKYPFREPSQMKWTIIGLGTIGSQVANVAKALGYEVCYYSTSGKNKNNSFEQLESLEQVFRSSDIVSIHSPLNAQTKNLIRKAHLDLMHDDGIVINMGRGSIINEHDLQQVNNENRLYFGIDVFENEPLAEDDKLLDLAHPERVLFSPHIAWASIKARQTIVKAIAGYINEVS